MTPEELARFDDWIIRVQDGLKERNAAPALRARVKENHEKLRAHLQQESERQAERLKWLTEGEGRPTFLAFVDKELKRLEGLNIPPDQKKPLKEHYESLKTDNPTPFPFPKPNPGSLLAGTSRQQMREWREQAIWNAQCDIWFNKRALERANSNEEREEAIRVINSSKVFLKNNLNANL